MRALSKGAQLCLHVKDLFGELGYPMSIVLASDATAALRNASNLGPGRLIHVDRLAMFVKEVVRRELVKLEKIDTKLNDADLLTKHVDRATLERLRPIVGLVDSGRFTIEKFAKVTIVNCIEDLTALDATSARSLNTSDIN